MKLFLKLMCMLLVSVPAVSKAQQEDTIWVNTLNFGDITKRQGTYQFPPAGNSYRQIKMHYTLKCDPQTKQDIYPCGEWDYLSYTNILDSTGRIDSTKLQHSNFMIGDLEPDSFYGVKTALFDTFYNWQYQRKVDLLNSADSVTIGSGSLSSNNAFKLPRIQYLFTTAELLAAGLSPGEITSLTFLIAKLGRSMDDVQIKLRSTAENSLTKFINSAFKTVYNGPVQISSIGELRIENIEPFFWDGASNLVLEISHNDKPSSTLYELAGDLSTNAIAAMPNDFRYRINNNSFLTIDDASTVFKNLDSSITISFWVKGGSQLPQNTSIIEAVNARGQRILNIHLPWSNGQMYWDAGNDNGGYDRINKAASTNEIKNTWNHWTFVKNASKGEMKIYLNGSLWHSGTGKKWAMKEVVAFKIGRGTSGNQFLGDLDRLSVWKTSLSETEIKGLMNSEITSAHPQFAHLLMSFDFDNYNVTNPSEVIANFPNNVKANVHGQIDIRPYQKGEHLFSNYFPSQRPMVKFIQANQTSHLDSVPWILNVERPLFSIELFDNASTPTISTGFESGYASGYVYSYRSNGSKKDSSLVSSTFQKIKKPHTYYRKFEVVNNIEIGRYITPYGIGFDLGPDGFRWEYDVTDYAELLTDRVTLSAGNQQELIDLKFEFIKGTPPRDIKRIDYLYNREDRVYSQIASDAVFKEQTINLDSTAKHFKLITRITGHGHNTDDETKSHCCEWANKKHYMKINSSDALEWDIWQDDKCALNPLIDQGGNWAPPRAGWCPGAPVDDYNFDITKFITGNQVKLDYAIEPVPSNNLGQGGGNYVISFHLVEYGEWNRQNDGAVTQILKPNNWEFYRQFNPSCATPRIVIKNTGKNNMTSCHLRYGVIDGNPIQFGWTGNLAPDATEEVDLPFAVWDFASTTNTTKFYAEITKVNGVDDEYPQNSRAEANFNIPKVAPASLELWFRNNNLADATVKITNDQGKIVYEKLDGAAGVLHKIPLTLDAGCYTLECVTENEFGLYYPLIQQVGNGLLRLSGNSFIQTFNPNFGKSITYNFTVAYPLNVEEKLVETNWKLFPNPSDGLVTIEAEGDQSKFYVAEVLNLSGQMVFSVESTFKDDFLQIDLRDQPAGLYLIRLHNNDTQKVFRFVKD